MRNLTQFITDNVGGLEFCLFTDWHNLDLSQWPAQDGLKLLGDLKLKAGAEWYLLGYTRHTADFDQAAKPDRHGVIYQHENAGLIPMDSELLGNELYDLSRRKLAVLFKDRNGYLRLCASPENWLELTYKLSSGSNPSERNGYQVKINGESPFPAFYYSGSLQISEVGAITPVPAGGSGSTAAPVVIKKGDGTVVAVVQPGQTFVINSGFSWGFNIL